MKKILLCMLLICGMISPMSIVIAKNGYENNFLTDMKTPVSNKQTTNVQSLNTGYGGDPIVYGDYLYTVKTPDWGSKGNGELLKINKNTMEIEDRQELIAKTGYTPFIEAGDGQIFVPLVDGRVQAFDAQTLMSTWVTTTPEKVGEVASRLTYYNGYLYYGIGGYSPKQGDLFICVNTEDTDVAQQFESKELTWTYKDGAGYYWSEAVVIGDCIAFSGYDGKIVLHDLISDKVYDSIDLGIGKITNSLFYDQNSKKIIAANTNGYIATVEVDNYTFNDDTLKKSEKFNGQFSSSPVCYNNRIYIGGGNGIPFTVLNLDTLETLYTIDGIGGQCTPLVSTAYASDTNHQEIQIYMINYSYDTNRQTRLYHITDNQINTVPNYQTLYILDSTISSNYWNGNIITDENAFYAYNGNGTIVKFAFDTSIQSDKDEQLIVDNINQQISNLPSKEILSIKLETELQEIIALYSKLSDDYKQQVKDIEKVNELINTIAEQNKFIDDLNSAIVNDLNLYYISQNDEILVNKLINIYQNINEINQEYVENYQDVLTAKMIIDKLKQNVISKVVFENILNEDIDYKITGATDNNLNYSITFNGLTLKECRDFNYTILNNSQNALNIKTSITDAFVIEFKEKNEFPGEMNLSLETTLEDGQYNLYYIDESNGKVHHYKDIQILDKKISLTMEKGGIYFVSKQNNLNNFVVKDIVKTGDEIMFVLPLLGITVGLLGLSLFRFKKVNN